MSRIKCMFGYHTGLLDSDYKYLSHKDVTASSSIMATYDMTCSRCDKHIREQNFAWLYDISLDTRAVTRAKAIKKAKKFTWNGIDDD